MTLKHSVKWHDVAAAATVGLMVGAVIVAAHHERDSALDRAQRVFEHSATRWPAPADFELWRSRREMKCRDFKGLRVCEVQWFNESLGVRDRVTFACSTDQCVWVDP